MNIHLWAGVATLALSAASALAQSETTEEQSVFVEVVGSNVQLPLSFAAAICGLAAEQVTTDFVGTTDAACTVAEDVATRVGLVDTDGELVDLTRQGFVNVLLPDNETRVQLPVGLAAEICEMAESEHAENSVSVRLVACELDQEQVEASGLPGLLASSGEMTATASGQNGDTGGGTNPGQVAGGIAESEDVK